MKFDRLDTEIPREAHERINREGPLRVISKENGAFWVMPGGVPRGDHVGP
jgi:hypothetical protein